jgi:hypothetical protein
MALTKNDAIATAKKDLAKRLGTDEADIAEVSVTDKDFPDMSLGAPVDGEMSAQMISTGWEIELAAEDDTYVYRADKYQLRLVDFEGENLVIGNN